MKYLKPKNTLNHGYSMVELLLVVSIIGVISALSYPVVRNFNSANAYAEARSKAEALTAAKVLFYRSDPYAKSKWENAQDDDSAQFDLIKPFLHFDSTEASLEEFAAAPPYNAFELGDDVRNAVSLIEETAGNSGNGNANGNGNGNNGHGNNEDGVDVSNPGQGHGGPNGEVDPSGDIDDEEGNGGGNGNGNGNGN